MSTAGKIYLVWLIFLLLSFCAFYSTAFASVRINEIAWMGTTSSANDEWMELYNTDSSSVDLSGWTLSATDGAPVVTLSGSISGNSYFLLERTDDSTVPSETADQIYSGALGNEGENLTLKNTGGSVIDTVNQSGGWEGGDNVTKETMQYTGSIWVTGSSTPRAQNVSGGSSNDDDDEDDEESDDDEDTDNDDEEVSETRNNVRDEEKKKTDVYTLQLATDSVIIAGNPARFTVGVYKNGNRQTLGVHTWNFGDGTFVEDGERHLRSDFDVTHTYQHPGTYVAVFEYRTSMLKKDPEVKHRVTINVMPHTVDISSVIPGQSITLENSTTKEVALDGWALVTSGGKYIFPRNTFLSANTKVTFSQETLGIPLDMSATLFLSDQKTMVSSLVKTPMPRSVSTITTKKTSLSNTTEGDLVITPLNEKALAATVLFADEGRARENAEKGNGNQALPLVLFIIVLALSIGGAVWCVAKWYPNNKGSDISTDEITILEDDE